VFKLTNRFKCLACGKEYVTIISVFDGVKSTWLCEKCYAKKYPVMEEKVCPNCGEIKPVEKFYPLRGSGGHRFTYWCKECIEFYIENTSVGAN